jgi:hypothetical protein
VTNFIVDVNEASYTSSGKKNRFDIGYRNGDAKAFIPWLSFAGYNVPE